MSPFILLLIIVLKIMSLNIENYLIADDVIALKFNTGIEKIISLEKLRKSCPCAYCSGESDVFGNNYKPSKPTPLKATSFKIHSIKHVGNYAFRIFWKDGHSSGIYTFNFLRSFSEAK